MSKYVHMDGTTEWTYKSPDKSETIVILKQGIYRSHTYVCEPIGYIFVKKLSELTYGSSRPISIPVSSWDIEWLLDSNISIKCLNSSDEKIHKWVLYNNTIRKINNY